MIRRFFDIFSNVVFFLLFLLHLYLTITSVSAHSWYDAVCCHDQDCAPVTQIIKRENGEEFVSKQGSVLVLPTDKITRLPSKDNSFHVCMRDAQPWEKDSGDNRPTRPICIYYPALF